MKTLSIEEIERIAEMAHEGQFRRDGKTPYFRHLQETWKRVQDEPFEVQATAFLHDVLEDTDETIESIREKGVPEIVIEAVQVLTKNKDQGYDAYLEAVRVHYITRKVKIADMLANLSDSPTDKQIVKYAAGLLYLMT